MSLKHYLVDQKYHDITVLFLTELSNGVMLEYDVLSTIGRRFQTQIPTRCEFDKVIRDSIGAGQIIKINDNYTLSTELKQILASIYRKNNIPLGNLLI